MRRRWFGTTELRPSTAGALTLLERRCVGEQQGALRSALGLVETQVGLGEGVVAGIIHAGEHAAAQHGDQDDEHERVPSAFPVTGDPGVR